MKCCACIAVGKATSATVVWQGATLCKQHFLEWIGLEPPSDPQLIGMLQSKAEPSSLPTTD